MVKSVFQYFKIVSFRHSMCQGILGFFFSFYFTSITLTQPCIKDGLHTVNSVGSAQTGVLALYTEHFYYHFFLYVFLYLSDHRPSEFPKGQLTKQTKQKKLIVKTTHITLYTHDEYTEYKQHTLHNCKLFTQYFTHFFERLILFKEAFNDRKCQLKCKQMANIYL